MTSYSVLPNPPEAATSGSTAVAKSLPRKFNFTRQRLDALPTPTGQRSYFYDLKVRGLALAVAPTGKKTFVLYRKIQGRPERITIGAYSDLSIDQARSRAEEMNATIALGQNPADDKRRIRDESTFAELFQTYLEHHSKLHKRTWRADQQMFDKYLSGWGTRRISRIRKMDVSLLHGRIGRIAPYSANRVIELLHAIFAKAREWDWQGQNPVTGVTPFPEEKRERFLSAGEMQAFFAALDSEPNAMLKDFFLVCLLTGARRGNVQAMRWEELDLAQAIWTIPAEKSKNGKPMSVTLSPWAVKILDTRKSAATSEWVFPSRWSDRKTPHLSQPTNAWKKLLKRAEIADLHIHDLRRTLGSWQAAQGTSLQIIGKSLGHSSLAATQVYARLNLDPVRVSVDKAIASMAAFAPAGLLEGEK